MTSWIRVAIVPNQNNTIQQHLYGKNSSSDSKTNMGCGSSREARPEAADRPASVVPSTRANHTAGITSQTAINAPLSTTTSRHQSRLGPGVSRSNISTPRSSTTGRQFQQHEAPSTDPYNTALVSPRPWTSKDRTWTRSQLQRERTDFFETRVTGRPEIWSALKEVTQLIRMHDLADAQGILDAAGITMPTGKLEDGAYDERGMLYHLPANIITDPVNLVDDDGGETVIGEMSMDKKLEANALLPPASTTTDTAMQEKVDKGKDTIEKDGIKVKCRLSDRGGPDTVILIGKGQPVSVLVRRLRSEATIASSANVRIVYFGKILKEAQSLEDQGWQPGHVVQALVSNFGP
ncbi:hypothetical protein LTR64_007073 [Lithohypha guttulata]|uniref:uncharacterized protein n=1 Tax=Lithohypha guttulata TaxID=1690604 RepID=UPI002DDF2761|nr:hypothetical protein LTR51_004371 [Lithohypha guttulata]